MNLLEEALSYLDLGWAVYPAHSVDMSTGMCSCGKTDCPCPGKHPVGRWTEYQDRLPTKREVTLWFSRLDCNIGMVTGGISKIVVVDIDGEEGISSAKKLKLDSTLSVRTGGGGVHLYYSSSESVSSKVRALKGIDIRADGGYVIMPPSLHKSGNRYRWSASERLSSFDSGLFKKLARPVFVADNWSEEVLPGVHQGSRNMTAARLAGRYLNLGLTLEETAILLLSWNERNHPPLRETEVLRTVKAIHKKHQSVAQNPVQIETFEQVKTLFANLL